MPIFFNIKLSEKEKTWSAQNGATRRDLVVINKLGIKIEAGVPTSAKICKLDKGNHSFIFINPGKDERILGIFLNNEYGYKVIEGEEIYTASSVGGYGNSESRFGIYNIGALIYTYSYKNRQTGNYFKLTENGWIEIPAHEIEIKDAEEI